MSRATIYNELPFIIKTHRQKNWKLLPKLGSQPVAFGPVFAGGLIGFSCATAAELWLADPPYQASVLPRVRSAYSMMFPAGSASFLPQLISMDSLGCPCGI